MDYGEACFGGGGGVLPVSHGAKLGRIFGALRVRDPWTAYRTKGSNLWMSVLGALPGYNPYCMYDAVVP